MDNSMNESQKNIFNQDAYNLVQMLKRKEISSLEIIELLREKIEEINPIINAYISCLFDKAIAQAREIDKLPPEKREKLHFFGLPISVQENLSLAGTQATMGIRDLKGIRGIHDSTVLKVAQEQGAIVIGKTNVSQLLLSHETNNHIWGKSNNPWNLQRSPGGSSGAEAAAIASDISFLGIGSDIAGSMRMACSFNGICGLKPTTSRWSNKGNLTPLTGQIINSQTGPMAKSARDVAFFYTSMLVDNKQALNDPETIYSSLPQPDKINIANLKIGFYQDDGFLTPAQSVKRAVKEAVQMLQKMGAEIIPITMNKTSEMIYNYLSIMAADGGLSIKKLIGKEAFLPSLKYLKKFYGLSKPMRKLMWHFLGFKGDEKLQNMLNAMQKKTVSELYQAIYLRNKHRFEIFDLWTRESIDAVICPAHATAAFKHGMSKDFALGACYSILYNYLDFPAGIAPVGFVKEDETKTRVKKDKLSKKAALIEKDSENLPLGVQIVAKPFDEDIVLAIMMAIEKQSEFSLRQCPILLSNN